jgi:hypothetical protein
MGLSIMRRSWAVLLVALAAMVSLVLPATTATAVDPPGNNGVIKLDGIPFDEPRQQRTACRLCLPTRLLQLRHG